MFTILNRWRGGALPFPFPGGGAKFVSFVLLIIFYLLTKDILISLLIALGYLLGESWGWGKWIGALCNNKPQYDNTEGDKNGIAVLANLIIPEKKDWKNNYRLSLFLRGLWWWIPVFVFVPIPDAYKIIAVLFLSIGFPIATELGRYLYTKYKFCLKDFACSCWGWQEVIYGFFQDLVFIPVFIYLWRFYGG